MMIRFEADPARLDTLVNEMLTRVKEMGTGGELAARASHGSDLSSSELRSH